MRLAPLLVALMVCALPSRDARAFDWIGRVEFEAKDLKSEDPQLRLQAVQRLQHYAVEWTSKHLLKALIDVDVRVRAAAGRVLAKHRVEQAIPVIVSWLAEPDAQSKQVAAELLGEMASPKAVAPLIRTLGDSDPTVRVLAVQALGKIGGEQVVVPLVSRLEDDKVEVRQATVDQLVNLGDTRAVIPLIGLFDDSSLDLRVAAIRAVGRLKAPAAVPALLRALEDSVEGVRVAAVTSLGDLQAVDATDELTDLFGRGSTALRAKVAYSLGQIAAAHPDDARARRALVLLVESLADNGMRSAAREALMAAGGAAVPGLIEHLQGKIAGDPATAVLILRDLGDRRATPELIAELDRGRISQKLVLESLGAGGDPQALLPILALLEDKEPLIRVHAMEALRPLLRDSSKAADVVVDRLADPEVEIAILAAEYLGEMQSKAAAPALVQTVRTATDLRLRATALSALGLLGVESGASVALEVLEQGPDMLRQVASDALSTIAAEDTIRPLLQIARRQALPYRQLAVDALTGTLRGRDHETARKHLEKLARTGEVRLSLAAIEALGAMSGTDSTPILTELAKSSELSRQRAALVALGARRDAGARDLFRLRLRSSDDRIASAAAWALAEIGDRDSLQQLLQAVSRRTSATPVAASAAIASLARAGDEKVLLRLLHHRRPLVRVNAAAGLARIQHRKASKRLTELLRGDPSWLVRRAAARALSQLGAGKEAIARAAREDFRKEVRDTCDALRNTPFRPVERAEWRVFRVVDPLLDDAPVQQQARFFHGDDGLVLTGYSDERGRIVFEHFAGGTPPVHAALADESRY